MSKDQASASRAGFEHSSLVLDGIHEQAPACREAATFGETPTFSDGLLESAVVRTTVAPDRDHAFVPNATHFVLAQLPEAPEDVKGIALFLGPKVPPQGFGHGAS